MATKATIRIGATFEKSEFQAVAKQISNVIAKGVLPADQKSSASRYLREVEEALRRIELLQSKRDLNRNDLNNLRIYMSNLENGMGKLNQFMTQTTAAPTDSIKKLTDDIRKANDTLARTIKEAHFKFKDATGTTFGNAPLEISNRETSIAKQEAELIINKARIEAEATRDLRGDMAEKAAQRAAEQAALDQKIADFNTANNTMYKDQQAFVDKITVLNTEIANSYYNDGIRQTETAKRVNDQIIKDQERVNKLLISKYSDKSKETRIKNLGITGIDSLTSAKSFMTDPSANKAYNDKLQKETLKTVEAEARARKQELALLIAANKELLKKQKIISDIKVLTDQEIANEAKNIADSRTSKAVKALDEDKRRNEELKTAYEEAVKAIQDKTDEIEQRVHALEQQKMAEEAIQNQKQADIVKTTGEAYQKANESLKTYTEQQKKSTEELSRAEAKQEAFGKVFSSIANKIVQVTSVIYLFRKATQQLRKSMESVSGIDKELTQIGIVTNQTLSELWQNFDMYNKAALELNTTTRKYLEGARIFYQQGMQTAQVMEMVAATTKAAALSNVSFESASETLTAAIRAFNKDASEATSIVDKFAAVGASSAANFKELSTAMEKVASSAYASGMEFDSLLGILAKGIETTREAPEAIGTALKTIIARFQEMKENPMADLEDGVNANRVEKALKTVGVSLRDANGEFRDLDDVLAELGGVWQDLSRNQKAYVATMAAGMRQQSRFMAIMNNYDRTLELVRISTNSAGEANRQFGIYADSMEAAQNKLTNASEAFYASITRPELMKQFYEFGTQALNFATSMHPLLLGLVGIFGLLAVKIHLYNVAIKVKNIEDGVAVMQTKGFSAWIYNKILAHKGETGALAKATLAQISYNVALAATLIAIAAVIAIVILRTKAAKDREMAIHREAAAAQQLANTELEAAQSLEAKIRRYQELNGKVNRSNEEQAEYLSLVKQISEAQPDLVENIDAEGNAILVRNSALEESIRLRKEDAQIAQNAAFQARMESLEQGGFGATSIEEGAPGELTAQANQRFQDLIAESTGLTWGVHKGTVANIGKQFVDMFINGTEEEFKKEGYLVMAGLLRNSNKTKEDIQKLVDSYYDELEKTVKVRNLETRRVLSNFLYSEGSISLSILESQGKTISNETKSMVAGFATFSSDLAQELFDSGDVGDSTQSELDFIVSKSKEIHNQLLSINTEFMDDPQYQIDLAELFKMQDGNFSGEEILTAVDGFKNKYINKLDDPELQKAAEPLFDSLKNTLFSEKSFSEEITNIGQIYQNAIGDESATVNDITANIEKSFKKLSISTSRFLLDNINNIESDEAKSQYIKLLSQIFDIDTLEGQDNIKIIEALMSETDLSDPTAIQAMRDQLSQMFKKAVPDLSQDILSEMTSGVINADVILTDFMKKAKESFDDFKTLQENIVKSITGLTLGDSLEIIEQYGAGSIEAIGEVFFLTGAAIQKEQARIKEQVAKDLGSHISNVQESIREINSQLNQTTDSGRKQDLQDELVLLEKQEIQMRKIADAVTKLSGADLARMANQNLLTGINAVAATAGSLKEIASLYERINEGSMTQLDIFNAIANNPDYLQFLTIQNGKLAFSTQLIEKETEARIAGMKTAIQERKIKVKTAIDALRTHIGFLEGKNTADEAALKDAVKGLESQTIAEQASQTIIQEELASTGDVVGQLNNLQQKAHEQEMRRLQAEINAYHARTRAMQGDTTASAGEAYGGTQINKIDIPTGPETVTEGSMVDQLAKSIGAAGSTELEKAKNSLALLETELEKLNALEKEIDTWKPKDFLAMAGSSKKSGGSSTKEFEKYFGEFDRYFNYLQKLEKLSSDISKIDAQIDLSSTGGAEEIRLIQEKSKKIIEQTSVLEQLLAVRKQNLTVDRIEMKAKYGKYVSFEEDQIKVRWDLINAMQITNEKQEKEYDAMIEAIEAYKESSAAIDENSQSLLENAKLLEEQAQALKDQTIDLRKRLYDALVEADQKEIDATKEKYDKMKDAESDYLSAVKNAIDKERKMRDDSNKEEDLAQKKRKLAVLERDTSGLYAQDAEKLRGEINKDEQALRDQAVDRQYEALQKQYELQQEQRDLEVESLKEQMALRQENGRYWDRVDEAIQQGPQHMQAILQSTEAYIAADPMEQERNREEFARATEYVFELYENGVKIIGNNENVVDAIRAAVEDIVTQTAQSAIDSKVNSSVGNGGGSTGSGTPAPSPSTGSPSRTKVSAPARTISDSNVRSIQRALNVGVDGKFGSGTGDAVMKSLINAIGTAMDYGRLDYQIGNNYLGKIALARSNKTITPDILNYLRDFVPTLYKYMINGPRTPWSYSSSKQFKEGGLVDFTGPAWVDGSKQKPESFLNAYQTKMFAHLAEVLEDRKSTIDGTMREMVNNVRVGDIIVNLQNPTNANPAELSKLIRKEILNTYQNRLTTSIQKSR